MSEPNVRGVFNVTLIDGKINIHLGSGNAQLVCLAYKLLGLEIDNWLLAASMQQNAKEKKIVVPEMVANSKLMQEIRGE